MKNRYEFAKKLYKGYIIFIYKKGKYYVFGNDLIICNCYDIDVNNVDKYGINYLILNNLEIDKIVTYEINRYYEYLVKCFIINILKLRW